MSEIKKPITANMKARCNQFYKYLNDNDRFISKQEFMRVFNISNERTVRDVLSVLSKAHPILSTSDSKGYKLAKTRNDLQIVRHTWAELCSRQKELEERKQPLIKFYDKYRYNQGGDN